MKHFGANLAGGMNTVDGTSSDRSVLTVNAGDSLVINDPNELGRLSQIGLVIESLNGSSHVLGADGREIDIATLATGGVHSTFNPTAHFLPVRSTNSNGQTEWADSLLSQIGGGTHTITRSIDALVTAGANTSRVPFQVDASDLGDFGANYASNRNIHAAITIAGFNGGNPIDGTVRRIDSTDTGYFYPSNVLSSAPTTGTAMTIPGSATSVASGNTTVVIDRPSTDDANLLVTGTVTLGADLLDTTAGRDLHVTGGAKLGDTRVEGTITTVNDGGDNGAVTINSGGTASSAGTVLTVVGDADIDNDLNVDGDLVVGGDFTITGQINRAVENILEVTDKYIIANHAETGTPTADGGMLVQRNTAIEQVSASTGTDGTHAGIRFNEDLGPNGGWETSVGTTNVGGADLDWVAIGSGTLSSVTVASGSGLQLNGMDAVTVSAGDASFNIHDNSEFVTTAITASGGTNAAAKTGGASLALNTLVDGSRGLATATAANNVLSANIATSGALTWIEGASGSVNKATITFTKAAAATFIRINRTGATGQAGVTMQHGLSEAAADNLYTVQMFETTATNTQSQILPEQIHVYTGVVAAADNSSTADTAAGDIIIELGATMTDLTGFVVIKS